MADKKHRRKRNVIPGKTIVMMSVERIAEKYGFSVSTVYNWVKRDKLRHVRHGPGGKLFIRKSDVEKFLKTWYEFTDQDLEELNEREKEK